jgi:hypothetical protein
LKLMGEHGAPRNLEHILVDVNDALFRWRDDWQMLTETAWIPAFMPKE